MSDENKKSTPETKPVTKKVPFMMDAKVAGECAGVLFVSGLLIGYGLTAIYMKKS